MDLTELQTIRDNFVQELQRAANGEISSLSFIKHPLPSPIVQIGETFQVVVIGGSVFRKALVKKGKFGLEILHQEEQPQPAFPTKDSFLNFITQHLAPEVSIVAMNFAYPLSPSSRPSPHKGKGEKLDGTLIAGTKENTFTGLINESVGEEIDKQIKLMQGRDITVSVANDAICLLLSGLGKAPKEQLAAAIMGTGTNITLFHEGLAINLESANFNKFNPSEECIEIDAQSIMPGRALFEKETAGAYLYQQFNIIIKKQNIEFPPLSSTKELRKLAADLTLPLSLQERESTMSPSPEGEGRGEGAAIAQSLIKKSASMLAAQLTGVAVWKQSDITIIMEGSFFWKNGLYKQYVDEYIKKLSPEYKIIITKVENSPVVGGAALVV